MQETSSVLSPAEITPVIPPTETTPAPEKVEKPKVIQVFQRAFARFEATFDRKRTQGTISDNDRVGFAVTNIEYQNSNGGEKVSVQSFTEPDGERRSIRRNVPLNAILGQLDEDIAAASDDTVRAELQADKDYLMENSRPLLRNDNRRELADKIIDRRAILIARAMTGSDSDAPQFLEQARAAIENERELIVPNPNVRADIVDTMVGEKTMAGLLAKLDDKLPQSDNIIPLARTRPGTIGRFGRAPQMEARRAIMEQQAMNNREDQQRREEERRKAERNTSIVQGILSGKNVLPFDRAELNARIQAMHDQTTATTDAVNAIKPLDATNDQTESQTVRSSMEGSSEQRLQVTEAQSAPTQPQEVFEVSQPAEEGDDVLAQVNQLDPLALGDRAAEHPEEFVIEEEETPAAESVPAGEVQVPVAEALPAQPEAPKAPEDPDATLQLIKNALPIEEPSQEKPISAYVAAHNNGNPDVVVDPQKPVEVIPQTPKRSFFTKVLGVFGLSNDNQKAA